MEFAKLHGLGNDFLVVGVEGQTTPPPSLSERARRICDRHRGVGADGVLFYHSSTADPDADVAALIFNADGSKAEMSGNGVRCLAAYLVHCGGAAQRPVRIRTVSGIKTLHLLKREGPVYTFRASMGAPVFVPARIPVRADSAEAPLVEFPIATGAGVIRATISSMGNPHCSTFWDNLDSVPIDELGPELEGHAVFPNRANVEFTQVVDRHRLRVRFWERGVGLTLASGTGSCAAAVAALLRGLVESPVIVQTELGSLQIEWDGAGEVLLTGPAEFICSGLYQEPGSEAR